MADMNKPLLEVKNLKTFFKTRNGTVKAVNDVSYCIYPERPSVSLANPVPVSQYPP